MNINGTTHLVDFNGRYQYQLITTKFPIARKCNLNKSEKKSFSNDKLSEQILAQANRRRVLNVNFRNKKK